LKTLPGDDRAHLVDCDLGRIIAHLELILFQIDVDLLDS
jgi:hypothetical protein